MYTCKYATTNLCIARHAMLTLYCIGMLLIRHGVRNDLSCHCLVVLLVAPLFHLFMHATQLYAEKAVKCKVVKKIQQPQWRLYEHIAFVL